jgi:hypothetical protein
MGRRIGWPHLSGPARDSAERGNIDTMTLSLYFSKEKTGLVIASILSDNTIPLDCSIRFIRVFVAIKPIKI